MTNTIQGYHGNQGGVMRRLLQCCIILCGLAVYLHFSIAYACGGNSPTGTAGDVMFNETYNVPQYCDGSNWIAMTGGDPLGGAGVTLPSAPTAGLVAHWTMDDASGNIVDVVNGNNGTPVGTPTYASSGRVGTGITFGASDGFNVGSPAVLDNLGPVTFAFWMYRTHTDTNRLIFRKDGPLGNDGWQILTNDTGLLVQIDSGLESRSQAFMHFPNVWRHIVVTWDGTTSASGIRYYSNGVEITTASSSNGTSVADDSPQDFTIGYEGGVSGIEGALDDIRIYDRVLSPAEVRQLYAATEIDKGYFVLIGNQPTNAEGNEFTGDLGGLSGADATCLSYLTSYDWNGRYAAEARGALTASNVQAWLCDDTTCRDMQPNTIYSAAKTEVGEEATGGYEFTTDANGFYPSTDTSRWDIDQFFARGTLFWTGRDLFSAPASGATCNGWTSSAGGDNGRKGYARDIYTDSTRWSHSNGTCNTTDQYVCIVGPASGVTPSYPTTTNVVPTGLVAHYRLDETDGTGAQDSSVSGNNGFMQNGMTAAATTTTGLVGNAMNFGLDNFYHIEAPAPAGISAGDGDVTIAAWLKFNGDTASADGIVGLGQANTAGWVQLERRFNTRGIRLRSHAWSGGEFNRQVAGDVLVDNEWVHIAITYSHADPVNTNPVMYINGELYTGSWSGVSSSGTYTPTAPVNTLISRRWDSSASGFNGEIDDVRIYDRVLNQAEVRQIYAARDGIRYNASAEMMEYFDGNGWVAMVADGTIGGGANPTATVSTYRTYVMGLSPIVYYRMDDTGSGTGSYLIDETNTKDGFYRNGATLGSTTASPADPGGTSSYFDDPSDQYAEVADDVIFDTTEGTVVAWFRADNAALATNQAIFAKDGSGDVTGQFWVGINNGNVVGRFQQDGGSSGFNYDVASSALGADVQSNTWYMLSMAYGTGGVSVYVNDALVGSDARLTKTDSDRPFLLAAENTTGVPANQLSGFIDEVAWFPTKMDATAIANLYAAGTGAAATDTITLDITSNLVNYWPMDDTGVTSTVTDAVGTANGTWVGSASITSAAGKIGTALDLTANTDYVDLGTTSELDNIYPFTMSAWVYPRSIDDTTAWPDNVIFTTDALASAPGGWGVNIFEGDGTLRLFGETSSGIDTTSNTVVPLNQWSHVVVTWDPPKTPRAFLNGSPIDATSVDSGVWIDDTGTRKSIGGLDMEPESAFDGLIDDVRLYNRAMTPAEVAALYAQLDTGATPEAAPAGATANASDMGCPSVGDLCADGTIYAGTSPDGGLEMFISALAHEGSGISWNNDSGTFTPTGMTNADDGDGNTATLAGLSDGASPHNAAQYCNNLAAHGADDWYLPAENELDMFDNGGTLIAEVTGGDFYWSSTETNTNQAQARDFDFGFFSNNQKNVNSRVRCVRKGPANACANPLGFAGSIVYNTSHNVMQFCNGGRWMAIGK